MRNIRKVLLSILIVFMCFISFKSNISAKESNVYVFYGKTCPHCEAALEYLNSIKDKYDLNIYKYEVWYDESAQEKLNLVADFLDYNVSGVPFVVINNTPISGYSKGSTDETYRYHIKQSKKKGFVDNVGITLGVVEGKIITTTKSDNKDNFNYKLPFIGEVDLKGISLPIVSIFLGLIDGFNPCAMWILLFLISTLIGMKDKKRLWILGICFLLTSSLVYLAFMLSYLEFAKMINGVVIARLIIALVEIGRAHV